MELMSHNGLDVILIGGQILPHTMSYVGPLALENIHNMRFDWAFLGTGGVEIDRGLTHSTMEEIPIKRAAAASAAKVVVLADSTKFGYNALSLIMPISAVHYIITEKFSDELNSKLRQSGNSVKVISQLPTKEEVKI
jgi:DeoR/GlpR family transcriptional regulator of sugar metabolism